MPNDSEFDEDAYVARMILRVSQELRNKRQASDDGGRSPKRRKYNDGGANAVTQETTTDAAYTSTSQPGQTTKNEGLTEHDAHTTSPTVHASPSTNGDDSSAEPLTLPPMHPRRKPPRQGIQPRKNNAAKVEEVAQLKDRIAELEKSVHELTTTNLVYAQFIKQLKDEKDKQERTIQQIRSEKEEQDRLLEQMRGLVGIGQTQA